MNAAAAAPGIIVLHGLMGTAASHFGRPMAAWRERRRVYPVDLPGHGACKADAPAAYYSRVADWFCRALEAVGPAHVVGASYLGGTLGLLAARRRPDLLRSLVVTGYTAEVPPAAFVAWSASFKMLADANPGMQAAYRQLHGPRWGDTLAAVTEDCKASYETVIAMRWSEIEALPLPVLLANGDLKQNEREAAGRYASGIGAITGRVIEDAGHLPMVDRPEAFAAAVEEFWLEQDGGHA
ncbi:MAG: alpha/beta fold hydrolase [Alphaproteobacteria bacterium]|nr:alpha/beta fold hydrolase [Alphaproteobacteria bacterium]MBV9370819.1 alpha/beta fold hydrolase [Alphaproteobacteria bacterium]MBV9900101.1 alpha/beta fold hydrolase [Alphaproteobacteria bacterium]